MRIAGAFRRSASVVSVMSADDGAFVDVNPAFERVTGWRRDDVIGRRPVDLDFWPDMDVRARLWARIRADRRVTALPVRLRRRDGAILHGVLDAEIAEDAGALFLLCFLRLSEDEHAPAVERDSYRSLYLAATEGIYRSLPDGGFIDVNPAMARIFGYDAPATMIRAVGMHSHDLYVDDSHRRTVYERLARDGRLEQARGRVRRADGSTIWISENTRAVVDEAGRVLFYEGSVVDITAEVAAEQALRQSEALYRSLIDHCRDGVFLVRRGRIEFANDALAHMLGYDEAAQLIGLDYMTLVDDSDRQAQLARRRQRESGSRDVQRYEILLVKRDGTRALFAVGADAVEIDGELASTGVMRDVTREREHQRRIEAAERRYRELFEQSPIGLFRSRIDGTILEVNPTMARMLGYATPEDAKRAVPDIHCVYAQPELREALAQRLLREGAFSDYEIELVRSDGRRLWANTNVRLIESEGEGMPHFAGSVQDVTQRREVELALQRSEAKYRTLVEHAEVGVFVMHGDRFVYVNRALARMLGYDEGDFYRDGFRAFHPPDYLRTAQGVTEGEPPLLSATDIETCLNRRDGSACHVAICLAPVDLDGVRHVTGTVLDITRHRDAEARLRFHAAHDALTGLPNRQTFQQRLAQTLQAAREGGGHDYAVLFLDLDGFKLINDSLGHAAGDRLLVEISHKLSQALEGEALVARYGGDEFTVLPTVPCDRARAEALAERLLRLFAAPFVIGPQQVYSGTSVGIVLGRPEYRTPDQVLRDADTAMYRAKELGKSAYVVFDEAMHRAARARFQLQTDFRAAFGRGEFRVHFQPLVDLREARIVGCEALVRWQHPQRGLLLPGEFLHAAEESGLIAELDWWVMEQACRALAGWHARYPAFAGLTINVNVDDRQLGRSDLYQALRRILGDTGLDPACLRLEVTETVFRAGRAHAEQTLGRLKALGVGLVVDDFGTGYSSLDSFAAAAFDALKIDRNFVRDIETNHRHRAIVRTITGFADDLGLALTAEGVETEAQRRLLLDLGCRVGQGWLFATALPAAEFESLLRAGLPVDDESVDDEAPTTA